MSPQKQRDELRSSLYWVVGLLVIAFAAAALLLVQGARDTDTRTNDIVEARKAVTRALAQSAIDACGRANTQDAGMIFLLDASVRSSRARRQPLSKENRQALRVLRRTYSGRDCTRTPVVRAAIKQKAITYDEVVRRVKATSPSM